MGISYPLDIDAENQKWKISVPQGNSSPVIWGSKIFLTGVEDGRLVTFAIDSQSGDLLWKKRAPEVAFGKVHTANTPAASSPCTDKKHVYSYFGSYGLLCYDHNGKEVWRKTISPPKSLYGMSTSPIAFNDNVILVLDDDKNLPGSELSRSKVVCYSGATGDIIWETPRPYNRSNWSTPMIWTHGNVQELIILGNGRVYGYNPLNGEEIWYVNGFSRETIAVPVSGEKYLFVSASMRGGRGDVKLDPEPFWKAALQFDANGDGKVAKSEITHDFTIPFRPELPLGHPGFGMPLPPDPEKRKQRQLKLFGWRDHNQDGFWTKEEFIADMSVGHGRPNLLAIRPGGRGDATESHVQWKIAKGIPEIPSPIHYENRIYMVRDGGVITCVNPETGEFIYQRRLDAMGHYAASPIAANGAIYTISSLGVLTILQAGDEFKILHQVDLETKVTSTPAFDKDSIYIRSEDALYGFR